MKLSEKQARIGLYVSLVVIVVLLVVNWRNMKAKLQESTQPEAEKEEA